jgi:molecular chaperone DnaJ
MHVQKRDYYEVLGVQKAAELGEIKKAYRRLAMEYHPDRNPGDNQAEDRFKELAEAYQVLSDPEKRQLYDRFGHQGPRQAGFEGFGGVEDILSHFAEFFGGGFGFGAARTREPRQEQGEDIQIEMTLDFAEAAAGCNKTVDVRRHVHCSSCSGSGAKQGTAPGTCGTCGGRGQVAHNQGIFMIATTCPTCRGRGRVVKDKCGDCRGSGTVEKHESVTVSVPPGIDEGQTLRVPGRGEAGPSGGPAGHLYVHFHVKPDPRWERDGDNLLTELNVSFAQAALGAVVMVPTLDGEAVVEIEPGTQPGTIHTLHRKGVRNVHGRGVGDMLVRINVTVPKRLSDEQRHLVEQLAAFDEQLAPAWRGEENQGGEEKDFLGSIFGGRKKKKR